MAWAGPYATRLLGDMGAEVIKVEAVNNWDLLRSFTGQPPTVERVWDKSPYFNHVNRDKYGCVLDLSQERGRELFLRLAEISDVVIENFRAEVMANLGLTCEALSAVNPQLIVVSMPGHGSSGPERDFIAYGTNVEQLSGLCHLTRYKSRAPRGCYRCQGDDQWLTIACEEDAQFAALCRAMGRPELASDARFADVVSRYRNQHALDGEIAAWTRERTKADAAEALQAAGVPASPVLSAPEGFEDPHLRARGFYEGVAHSVAGVWEVEGPHWRFSESPAHIRLPAPAFGEHNGYVLRELLGLSKEEVAALEAEGVTGSTPNWAVHE